MLKYLIIQLCNSAPSFCHYPTAETPQLIPLDVLKDGLLWAVKSGLAIQVVYPDYELPEEYESLLGQYDHVAIGKGGSIETLDSLEDFPKSDAPAIIRLSVSEFIDKSKTIADNVQKLSRLNIVFTDVESFTDEQISDYSTALNTLANALFNLYQAGATTQVNIVSDRMLQTKMNNCNAGDETITLAPDGKFYVCPGYYFDGFDAVGDPEHGVNVANKQLYQLKYAPICRNCDAWHCKRCVWLNKKMTLEVNTPSREQCVMAHLEREASRKLLARIREVGEFMPEVEIPELDYLDPFDKLIDK